ncbi:carbonic anhydrase [Psychrobacter lutiphocae]|uniref:carbonic anhydrase n=1 Tax=Psychrobacter lutiphocae TaxID=540500 RepID=UPI000365F755|nr:carbonic anhydrase family protein [Psychrobacter lutiphocae]
MTTITTQKKLSAILTVSVALALSACSTVQPDSTQSASWSYTGETAPQYWGNIEGYEVCKTGQEQSPVNITKVEASSLAAPKIQFKNSDMKVVDNGHTIVYTPTKSNNITTINGETYTLQQFHYHTPSEHQFSGTYYPGELHFVHANADGDLAVVGVMLNPSAATDQLTSLVTSSEAASRTGKEALAENININALIPANSAFYHYDGSLTTPPCSEKVDWYVVDTPLSVSEKDLGVLKVLYPNNNRPVQPLGHRKIVQVK